MRNEIIHVYSSLVTKIERIQLEVDKSQGQFFTGSVPWSPMIRFIAIALTTGTMFFVSRLEY